MKPEAYEELDRFESTHGWYVGMRFITNTLLRDILDGQRQNLILDAGCGAGGNLTMFRQYGQAFGLDFSPLALAYAKQHHAGRLVRAGVCDLPYPDGIFDLVTTFDVIYHSAVRDDARAIREMARVTKPGGHVLIREPALAALRGSHDDLVHGARRYTATQMVSLMEAAGLTMRRVTYANSLLMPMVRAWRGISSRLHIDNAAGSTDVTMSSGPASTLLRLILEMEARWIGQGNDFKFGVSLFAVAQKQV